MNVPIGAVTGAAGGAAGAAAAAHRQMLEEEEEMTPYGREDLEGWEFKILRAITRRFRRREELDRILAEEAQAGWELVEKFDDSRIRLKRRVESREGDRRLDFDPYRTQLGMGQGALAMWIVAGAVIASAVAIVILALALD